MGVSLPGGPDRDPVRDLKFKTIADAILGTANRDLELRVGSSSVTFSASKYSSTVTINHGLGRVPVALVATAAAPGFDIDDAVVINRVSAMTATSVNLQGRTVSGDAVGPGDVAFSWIAIG